MTTSEMEKFFLPNLFKKDEEAILSNEEVFKKLVDKDMNLCFSKSLKGQLDFFFESSEEADICGYKIVRLTLTDDMKQVMGQLAISIAEKLNDYKLFEYVRAISVNLEKELDLRMAFNEFFLQIGQENKILVVLSNFYEHFSNISQADIRWLQAFISKCRQCRLWICGDGEWYRQHHTIFLELFKRFEPIYEPLFEALRRGKDLPAVYISYKWKGASMDIVDTLCDFFKRKQIYYKRDKEDCRYSDNITEFMDEIRAGNIVIVVLSEAYLKSFNCLYEFAGLLEHPDFMKRIFPIVVDESVRGSEKYVELENYWSRKKADENYIIKRIISKDKSVLIPLERKVELIDQFIHQLQKLEKVTEELNSYTLKGLKDSSFEPLLRRIRERLNENEY